jgi:two-component system response regulator AtoC
MITTVETALVVDDDALMREFVVESLRRNGISVTEAGNGEQARGLLGENAFDLAFLDLKMPGMGGMDLLRWMKEQGVTTLPVIITAFGSVEQAVEAMKMGAYDFLMKPFSPEQVELIIKRAKELVDLQVQNTYLKEELGWILPRGRQIVGKSAPIQRLMRDVHRVAGSSSNVLITGESGTGKELVALAIHSLSDRKNQPFIRMNCAAVPDALMDSELFGHEKGSFTSAISRRVGRFEMANRGTLLLDEISEMNQGVQAKLLRVLQEQEFERVGGNHTIQTDCRVLATSNRNLREEVEKRNFRQDLYYRLNVVPIEVPSLRDRREDIPLLAQAFIEKYTHIRVRRSDELRFSDEAMACMQGYDWPGNVREMENLVERLCVMEEGPELGVEVLPTEISHAEPVAVSVASESLSSEPTGHDSFLISEIERKTILRAMRHVDGNRKKSAELLGISIRTLRNKLNQYRDADLLPADIG